jgi:TRAP-type C4-dicarboxylate transport system substrate-binding protein
MREKTRRSSIRTVVAVAALGLAVAAVAGCGARESSMSNDTKTLKLATDSGAKGSPAGNAMDRWAELIETGTNGELDVRVFYQNELGGQQNLFDLYIANDVNLTLNWPMTSYDPRIAVIYTPYMFMDWENALEAYRPGGWMHALLSTIYADLGLMFFGAWPEGFNGVATKDRYATSVAAAAEMKLTLRAAPIFPFPETVQAMGYQTATIDWGEVYPAIQMGVVDGDAANVIYWDYEFFRDVIDFYTHTKQQFNTGILSINLQTWGSMSPEQRKVVKDAAMTIMDEGFENARARDRFYVEKAQAAGITYVELSAEELDALARAVRDRIWPMMEERIGKPTMDTVRANTND